MTTSIWIKLIIGAVVVTLWGIKKSIEVIKIHRFNKEKELQRVNKITKAKEYLTRNYPKGTTVRVLQNNKEVHKGIVDKHIVSPNGNKGYVHLADGCVYIFSFFDIPVLLEGDHIKKPTVTTRSGSYGVKAVATMRREE